MDELHNLIAPEEFDYLALREALRDYARPRDKITALLRSGTIIRVKKGLYIFGPRHSRAPYSRELLANLMYGPSYVSLEYALSYYGIIPERTETVTSATCGKSRTFSTPAGRFTYWAVPVAAYRMDFDLVAAGPNRAFLMASREKALADYVCHDRGSGLRKASAFASYLFESLRVDATALAQLDPERLARIGAAYRSNKIRLLAGFIRSIRTSQQVLHE
jgi:hypothetical protein